MLEFLRLAINRKTTIALFLIVVLFAFPSAVYAAVRHTFLSDCIDFLVALRMWLRVAPQICDLLLIGSSLYLMLDGVRRWGTNRNGAFSRSLIGLFILHTSSLQLPFLPYLALFLEIWLCARGLQARTQKRLLASSAVPESQRRGAKFTDNLLVH